MEILFWILVTYVTADLVISGYVVYRRGGIKATVADIRSNLGLVRDSEEYDDVDDQW